MRTTRNSNTVHPHGRGDNSLPSHTRQPPGGSPPRAWGQCRRLSSVLPPQRFTPTGVGTMNSRTASRTPNAVHPHGRGDNRRGYSRVCAKRGSPPRAWGQCLGASLGARSARFTPTGVGTILNVAVAPYVLAVHPHGRGDNHIRGSLGRSQTGSPPRAWGQCARNYGDAAAARFTPTGVGTIAADADLLPSKTVHPHGRGDNAREVVVAEGEDGSPPRAWGQ